MTYDLFLGDRMYSSWSLRGWLMFENFGIPHKTQIVGLYAGTMAEDLASLAPARLVPAVRAPDGLVIGESLAIAETLAEAFPDAGLWPQDPAQRATARWIVTEMVAGFVTLRSECPMQFQRIYDGFVPSNGVIGDLDRLETLWNHARAVSGAAQGWLFGDYCLADVFYVPVAARILGYGLPVSDAALSYCHLLLEDPAVKAWQKEAHSIIYDPDPYPVDLPSRPWPV